MKRIITLGIIMVSILSAGWQRVIGWSDEPLAPKKEVMKSDTACLFIKTMVYGFNKNDTVIDNKNFQQITIPESELDSDTTRAGKPQIPYLSLLIAVPDSCGFNITVYPVDCILFDNYLLYPIPRIVFEDSGGIFYFKEVYTYDTTFYQKDTLYPNKFYEIKSDGHWRDQRVLEVFLYPVQFNPQKKLMYFYTGIDLKIEYTGKKFPNLNGLGPFEDMGREILLNYPGIDKSVPAPPPPAVHFYTDLLNPENVADYIIVTHFDFLNNKTTEKWIYDFAQWRVEHNRFDVGIVKVQDIFEQFPQHAPDSAAQLRDFLIYAYNNWKAYSSPDGHLAYCLFIGDWDYVPAKLSIVYNPGFQLPWLDAQEYYFRHLSTPDDWIDDIMLGRWPVKERNARDLITIVQKTINYEKYPALGDWRRRGLLIAGGILQNPSEFDWYVLNSIPYFTDINYGTIVIRWSQIGNSQAFAESIQKYLNLGEIIGVYYDHGGAGEWVGYDTGYVKNLSNRTQLPSILSFACLTAKFQWDHPFHSEPNHSGYPGGTSLGEHFLFKEDGGSVAFYGATNITSPFTANFGLLCIKRCLRYQDWILGKMVLGCAVFLGGLDYCLLGDPALDLGDYTAYPNLPDLVVRPQGIDIELLSPYPYPSSGTTIPITAKVFNIGHITANNVRVRIRVEHIPSGTLIWEETTTIAEVKPRTSVVTTVYWNTGETHPGFYGEIGDCKIEVMADPDNQIQESWEYNNKSSITRKVVLYPNQPGWPRKVTGFSQPAIANLDNTPAAEIVYASLDSIYIFDKDGHILNGWPRCLIGVYGVALADIDANGYVDIVAVSPESLKVYLNDGTNISLAWAVPVPSADYSFTGLPAIGRIEVPGSTALNIVVVASSFLGHEFHPLKVFVYNYEGNLIYSFSSSIPVRKGIVGSSIGEISGTGNKEIIISYYRADLPSCKTEVFNHNGLVMTLDYGNPLMTSALADLNNDNYAEVIVGCADNYIRAYDVQNDQLLWERLTEGPINSSPAVGDIHPAPQYPGVEITFGNDGSAVNLRRNDNGEPIPPWSYIISPSTMVRTSPAIADINGDRYLDIIIGANNQYIYAFNYRKELILPFPLPLFGYTHSSSVIGDIDGDRKSEIIFSSSDGYLHIWKNLNSRVTQYLLEWPQFHHDYQRTGLYGWSP